MYAGVPVIAEDIAEIITFAINRPLHLTINEILVRPTGPPAKQASQAHDAWRRRWLP